jgi:hypothetical protein
VAEKLEAFEVFMSKTNYCVLIFIIFLLASWARGASFQKAWDQEEEKGFSSADSSLLAGKHVIFIAGIMNELTDFIHNYFPDNMKAVKQLGGTYSYIGPSSSRTIPENAKILFEKINKIYIKIKKPLILIGHSKGGAESLYLLLEHPELIINGIVERTLLIQPAIGGSPMADNASGILFSLSTLLIAPNMRTLSTFESHVNFNKVFDDYNNNLKLLGKDLNRGENNLHEYISSRIFYIRSRTKSNLSFGLKIVLTVMQDNADRYCEDHDGLLSVDAQIDKRIGIDFEILEDIDHIDLVIKIFSNLSSQKRESFTRAAFKSMYIKASL